MSKQKEQSAIDAIYTLLEKVDLLDKKIEVVDTNVKHLNNKVSKILNTTIAPAPPSAKAVRQNTAKKAEDIDRLVIGPIKVFGRIADKNLVPIVGVVINVYDKDSELIKSEESDSDGYWDVRLPPGKYGVEYNHSRFKSVNRTINIDNKAKSFEVK